MYDIKLNTGVLLKSIPISPNEDYMAGSDGNIYTRTAHTGLKSKVIGEWRVLREYNNGHYKSISVCHNGVKFTKFTHQLVCMAFHGLPPSKDCEVRHLDSNSFNNVPENLRWGTRVENALDRKIVGGYSIGENHHNSKLSNFERHAIKWAIQKGLVSQRQAARVLGVTQGCIYGILHKNKDVELVEVK